MRSVYDTVHRGRWLEMMQLGIAKLLSTKARLHVFFRVVVKHFYRILVEDGAVDEQ